MVRLFFVVIDIPCDTVVVTCREVSCCTLIDVMSIFVGLKVILVLPCINWSGLLFCNLLLAVIKFTGFLFCLICTEGGFSRVQVAEVASGSTFGSVLSFSN